MECLTIRRGYFRGLTSAEKTGTLESLAARARPWDSNPSRKNEIECCVDRLSRQPKSGHPGPSGRAAKNEMCYGVAGNTNLLGPNSSQVVMNQNIRFCRLTTG